MSSRKLPAPCPDIVEADPAAPGVAELVAAHVARSQDLYAAADASHVLDVSALAAPGVTFFAGMEDGAAVVIGALRDLGDGAMELKSMHTREDQRGRGLGRLMLRRLIAEARARGARRLLLETGTDDGSAAARGLYEAEGFVEASPFADYVHHPLSVYLERDLATD